MKRDSEPFLVYPIPSENVFHIELGMNHQNVTYEIIDLNGRLMESGQLSKSTSVGQHLGNGAYVLQLKSNAINQTCKIFKK